MPGAASNRIPFSCPESAAGSKPGVNHDGNGTLAWSAWHLSLRSGPYRNRRGIRCEDVSA